jgi:hypothetical protein
MKANLIPYRVVASVKADGAVTVVAWLLSDCNCFDIKSVRETPIENFTTLEEACSELLATFPKVVVIHWNKQHLIHTIGLPWPITRKNTMRGFTGSMSF